MIFLLHAVGSGVEMHGVWMVIVGQVLGGKGFALKAVSADVVFITGRFTFGLALSFFTSGLGLRLRDLCMARGEARNPSATNHGKPLLEITECIVHFVHHDIMYIRHSDDGECN